MLKWHLRINVMYAPHPDYTGIPGFDAEPWYEFAELDELLAFIRDIGQLADGLDEYADCVKAEGEIMERVVGTSALKGRDAIDRAVRQAIRRELPPASSAGTGG